MEKTANDIIEKAKSGDNKAVDTIYESFRPFLKSFSRTYFLMGGESDDLIQEGMLGLFNAIRNYDETKNASFETFASRCIYRRIMTAIRLANARKHSPLNYANDIDAMSPDIEIEADPLEQLLDREAKEHFWQVVDGNLSATEKSIVKLYVDGYSYQVIADTLGKDTKAVDNALQRARSKLARELRPS